MEALRFPLEPPTHVFGNAQGLAQLRPPNKLDRRRTGQQAVIGFPDFAHSADPQLLHQPVAAQIAFASDLGAQGIYDAGADVGHDYDEEIRKDEGEDV